MTFTPLLDKVCSNLLLQLPPQLIRNIRREAHHRFRHCLLLPELIIHLFLIQVLNRNTALAHLPRLAGLSFTDSAYCQARKRLPLVVFQKLRDMLVTLCFPSDPDASPITPDRSPNRGLWIVDGTSFSMPDTQELRDHSGIHSEAKEGCGFPTAKCQIVVDLETGAPRRIESARLFEHDLRAAKNLKDLMRPGDVVVGDRAYGVWVLLTFLILSE